MADLDSGRAINPDDAFLLGSVSKTYTATLILRLAEEQRLSINDPLSRWIPDFPRGDEITLAHLLQHTSGLRDFYLYCYLRPDRSEMIEMVTRQWTQAEMLEMAGRFGHSFDPGADWSYSNTNYFLLGVVAEREAAMTLAQAYRHYLLDPLGLPDLCYGVSADRVHEVAKHTQTGPVAPPFMARIFTRTIGLPLDRAVELTNTPEFLTATLPSANGIGTGRAVSAFLQLLLDRGRTPDGTALLKPETVDRMVGDTTPLRVDGTFGLPMRYGLGVMRGGTAFSLFGLNTPGAFGHLGFTNVVVWADPDRDLAVSFLNTGKPMLAPGMVQWYRVLQRLSAEVPRK